MASLDELKQVVKETLEARGTLGQIRARIRAEVYNALDDPTDDKPEISSENFIINELILEYLEFNKYKYAASVLRTESGQPLQPLDRQFLREELNVREDRSAASVPLLYSIVGHFLHKSQPRNSAQEFDHRDQSWVNPDVESDSAQRSGILFSNNGERR